MSGFRRFPGPGRKGNPLGECCRKKANLADWDCYCAWGCGLCWAAAECKVCGRKLTAEQRAQAKDPDPTTPAT